MISENIIRLGYGDVAVGSIPIARELSIQGFKPPHECGENLRTCNDIEYITDKIYIEFDTEKECIEFRDLLSRVKNKEIEMFEFKSYIFDFSNYNEKSINIFDRHVKRIEEVFIFLSAC